MQQSQYWAVAKIAMHNREHVVILRPGGSGLLLHTMYYVDEIRQGEEYHTNTDVVKERELELAKTLISTLADNFQPEKYHDAYRENIQQMIQAKLEGHKIVQPPAPKVAPVVDIMEALKQSLERKKPEAEHRKPVQSETAAHARHSATKKRGRSKAS
jgi:DNA end-binding protein Ku